MKNIKMHTALSLTPRAAVYILLLAASLVFAQLLRRPVTYMLFLFVLFLPVISLIWLAAARLFIFLGFRTSETVTEKQTQIKAFACIKNKCPLPFPFVTARAVLPDSDGIKCIHKDYELALLPFCSLNIEETLRFAFRGKYTVGVKCIYVYDIFRAMRLRIPCRCDADVLVLPRRLTFSDRGDPVGTAKDSERASGVAYKGGADSTDTRIYEPGDSIRRIHWKLSSKSEELIVRIGSHTDGCDVKVLCDLFPCRTGVGEIAEKWNGAVHLYHGDAVIESASAAVSRELSKGNSVALGYVKNGAPIIHILRSAADFDSIFAEFAAAELDETKNQLSLLASVSAEITDAAPVLVSAAFDDAAVDEYITVCKSSRGRSAELILCSDDSLFIPDADGQRRKKECMARLAAADITVTEAVKYL